MRLDLGSGQAGASGSARLSTGSIRKIVRDLGTRSKLSKPVAPHQLRHVVITTTLDRTHGDLRAVARFSRHRNLQTLTLYDDNRQDLGGEVAAIVAQDEP